MRISIGCFNSIPSLYANNLAARKPEKSKCTSSMDPFIVLRKCFLLNSSSLVSSGMIDVVCDGVNQLSRSAKPEACNFYTCEITVPKLTSFCRLWVENF